MAHGFRPHRRIKFIILGFAASLAWGCGGSRPERLCGPACQAEQLDEIVAGFDGVSPELSGLQVSVLKGGEPVFSYAKGVARIEPGGQETPLTTAHKVRVASISKLVLTIGLMQLVESGEVNLDEDVSVYLGFPLRNPAFPEIPITLRQVLSHTSSIRDADRYWLDAEGAFSDFFLPGGELFAGGAHFAQEQGKQPGRYFEYSNLNFGLAAAIIERVSGERFDIYMHKRVFAPLGLNISYSPCDVTRIDPALLASTFRRNSADGEWTPEGLWRAQVDGEKISCHVGMTGIAWSETPPAAYLDSYEPGSNPTYFSPQGGLRASAEDLTVLMSLLINRGEANGVRLLRSETADLMLKPVWRYDPAELNGTTTGSDKTGGPFEGLMTAYGLSVNLADLQAWGLSEERRVLAGHLGDAYGLLGQFWFDPETGDGIVALITGTADDPEAAPVGSSALYRPEEEILRWWLANFGDD